MKTFLLVICTAFALFALIRAETTCQSHQRSSTTSNHGLKWNIECDENGDYLPLQCTEEENESKRWCACYNKDEAITGPSRKKRYCECHLAADEAKDNADTCDVPTCANTGRWEPKQCCPRTNKCHCVDTNTGAKTTEPSTNANLQCS